MVSGDSSGPLIECLNELGRYECYNASFKFADWHIFEQNDNAKKRHGSNHGVTKAQFSVANRQADYGKCWVKYVLSFG